MASLEHVVSKAFSYRPTETLASEADEFVTQLDKQRSDADKTSSGLDGHFVYMLGSIQHGNVEQSSAKQQAILHVITKKNYHAQERIPT